MGNPVSRPEIRRTCPSCNRPVAPDYNFCEICGTRIPVPVTCSKCGTQFVHPTTYCPTCGALLIPEEIPEPAGEEIPEPRNDGIQEPDTDELLEKYGAEFGDDETLESCHNPKYSSPLHRNPKKPVTDPALKARGSSATADDALFLLDTEPGAAKPPVTRILMIGGGIALITILAAVFFIVLPIITGNGDFSVSGNTTAGERASNPEPTPAKAPSPQTGTPGTATGAFVPLPTQIPSGQKFYFQVQKNPVTSKISVIFIGSAGFGSITSADIRVTHADGSVTTGIILPLKGVNEIILDGSKEIDRVEIIAKMASGETYRVYDDLVPFRM